MYPDYSKVQLRQILESIDDGFFSLDREWRFLYLNACAATLLGYSANELLGKNIWEVFPAAMESPFYKYGHRARDNGETIRFEEDIPFLTRRLAGSIYSFSDGVFVHFRDVTEQERLEYALRESDLQYRELFRKIPLPTYMWKRLGEHFRLIAYNDAARIFTGGRIADLIGSSLHDLYANVPGVLNDFLTCIERQTTVRREMYYCLKSTGEWAYLWVYYAFVPPDIVIVHTEDITERKQIEENLRQHEVRLAEAQRIARLGYWELDLATYEMHWSTEFFTILGFSPLSAQPSMEQFLALLRPNDRDGLAHRAHAALQEGEAEYELDLHLTRSDGEEIIIHLHTKVVRDNSGKPIQMVGTVLDMTDRVRAQELLITRTLQQAAIVELGNLASAKGTLTQLLNDACRVVGRTLGAPFSMVLKWRSADETFQVQAVEGWPAGIVGSVLCEGGSDFQVRYTFTHESPVAVEDYGVEQRFQLDSLFHGKEIVSSLGVVIPGRKKSYGVLIVHSTVRRTFDQNDHYFLQTVANTLSEAIARHGMYARLEQRVKVRTKDLRAANEALKTSLHEKEVLLREIHHRVKNNLQIVSSLLHLQSTSTKDSYSRELLRESQNRVRVMALVHEQLYRSIELARVDLGDYLTRLARFLLRTYEMEKEHVRLSLDTSSVLVETDTAIPCGLILNELMTNAFKHAFAKDRRGEVTVMLKMDNQRKELILVVGDNGIGLPSSVDFGKPRTMGLQLVQTFAAQLRGDVKLKRTLGTEVRVIFPYPGSGE